MNRHATCSSSLLTRKKTSFINNNVSKPLRKDEDKKLAERLENVEKKLVARLENVEKQLEATNITLDEVKEDLKNTNVLLNDANVEIEELKAELNKMKAEQVQLAEAGKFKKEKHHEPERENRIGNVRAETSAENEKDVARITALHNAYVKLPYDSIDELKVFKDDLKNAEVYNHLKNRLVCIGGDGITECVTGVLNAIMTPKLQGQISLTGKGTEKDSLLTKFKAVSDLIHDVVRANCSDYKNKMGNEIIGKLLRSR